MYSDYQIKEAKKLIPLIVKQHNSYRILGKPYIISLFPMPTCECYHFTNTTIHQIKLKTFFEIHWCKHLLAIMMKENYKGFNDFIKREEHKEYINSI